LKARACSETLIDLWDRALDAPPVDRALDALVIGLRLERAEVEALPVGRRDELLFDLREHLFGEHFDAVTTCPSCGELIEAGFDAADLRTDPPRTVNTTTEVGEWAVSWRLPTSADLRAVARYGRPPARAESGVHPAERGVGIRIPDLDAARAALVDRCVVAARRSGEPIDEVPNSVLAHVVEDMGRADPGAEISFELSCPYCAHTWSELFDIAEFFWSEVDSAAGRLLEDVGTLAAAYGWSERDILAMGPARRERYLELAT
jgi:hypothetical protein